MEVVQQLGVRLEIDGRGESFTHVGGTFPRYQNVTPVRGAGKWDATFGREDAITALAEIKGLAETSMGIVRIVTLPSGHLVFGASALDGDTHKSVKIKAILKGEAKYSDKVRYIGANFDYLRDVMTKVFEKGQTVNLEVYSPESPMRFDGGTLTDVVLMPVFIDRAFGGSVGFENFRKLLTKHINEAVEI